MTALATNIWAKAIKDAYEEGCWAISTYNDEPTETVDEAWERSDARSDHDAALAASAPAPQPVANNWTQMLGRMSWCYESNCMRADEDGPFVAYSDVVAVAPKAAPTLAKDLLDVLGLPGTAGIRDVVVSIEDLKAAVHDAEEGHNQPAAPLQHGEYPPLPEPLEIHWPELNAHALGCGVEDRGMHDRYRCAEYGWQDGVDRAVECVPEKIYDAEQMHAYVDADRAAQADTVFQCGKAAGRQEMKEALTTAPKAVPVSTDRWRERWYGSGGVSGLQGWSIINDRTSELVAYLGTNVSSDAVSEIVMAHNSVTPTQPNHGVKYDD